MLGQRLVEGRGIPQAETEGLQLLREAAEGSCNSLVRAQFAMAMHKTARTSEERESAIGILRQATVNDATSQLILASVLLSRESTAAARKEGRALLRSLGESKGAAPLPRFLLGCSLLTAEDRPSARLEGLAHLTSFVDRTISIRDAFLPHQLLSQMPSLSAFCSNFDIVRSEISKLAVGVTSLGEQLIDGIEETRDASLGVRLLLLATPIYGRAYLIVGQRFLHGDGVPRKPQLGRDLIGGSGLPKEEVELHLAERLLDGSRAASDPERGFRIVKRLARTSARARRRVAECLIDGNGIATDSDAGLAIVRGLAATDPVAKVRLAVELISGRHVTQDLAAGRRALVEATATADDAREYASKLADKAFDRREDFQVAFEVFLIEFTKRQTWEGGVGVSYLLRRDEAVPPSDCPTHEQLLAPGLARGEFLADVSSGLLAFQRSGYSPDGWRALDERLANVDIPSWKVPLWSELVEKHDDAEGHLVLGLLLRHHDIKDCGFDRTAHLLRARAAGFAVPDCLMEPVEG